MKMIPKNRGWRIREGAHDRTTPVTAVLQLLPTPGGVRQVCTLTSTLSASSSSRSPPAGATSLSHELLKRGGPENDQIKNHRTKTSKDCFAKI
uniref:Uncharacterized protein n=1 Tax=Oryza glumipatula TaxID=40148 RepID=A0A0E0B2P7_9ORYZ